MGDSPRPRADTSERFTGGVDPREDVSRAWEIAVNPERFSKIERKHLHGRGIQAFTPAGGGVEDATKPIVDATSKFIADILDRRTTEDLVADPREYLVEPGQLALVMGVATILTERHDTLQDDHRRLKFDEVLYEGYLRHLLAARQLAPDNDAIRMEMGRMVYSRSKEDDYGPPAGRTIEGITRLDAMDGLFYKVPITHANRHCFAWDDAETETGLLSLVDGPYVHIPEPDVVGKYEQQFLARTPEAALLKQALDLSASETELAKWYERLHDWTGILQRIDELISMGNDRLFFKERQYPPEIEVILRSVKEADSGMATLGAPLTAKEIHQAVESYTATVDASWIQSIAEKLDSPMKVSKKLTNAAEDGLSHITVVETREREPNRYELSYKQGDFKQIDVSDIGDLMEFPCMANMHESLLESKPVRWELYSFVRYLFEVKEVEFTVEDIKEWFSQYPWYDEATTDYQVRYEKTNTIAGDRPFPLSCSNDNRNWTEHCIGKENCEYSLYQSVELRDDVYDRLN